MNINAALLKQTYIDWVKNTDYIDIGNDWIELQTPFTNIYGDVIVLFFKKFNDKFCLTDYGNTLNEFSLSDIKMSKQRRIIFDKYIRNQDCLFNDNAIYVETKQDIEFLYYLFKYW